MKIYLAGPFFNPTERQNIEKARDILRAKNLDVFVPMEHKFKDDDKMPNDVWGRLVFEMDRDAIYNCDAIVFIYYGLYSDSGTAWEVGFAKALNKKVIAVHTDYNGCSSIMIHNAADYNLDGIESLKTFNFDNFLTNTSNVNNEQK